MAIAAHRHKNARFDSTVAASDFVTIDAISVATSSTAAAANHFSCSLSSPSDRANRTTTAATLTTSAAGKKMKNTISTPVLIALLARLKGSGQKMVACASTTRAASVNTPPTNHAAGRHRRERSRPSGKSRNTNASIASVITQTQFDNQATARPAGSDPGAATSARSA